MTPNKMRDNIYYTDRSGFNRRRARGRKIPIHILLNTIIAEV